MTILGDQIKQTLLPGMKLPEELEALFSWIETNSFYVDQEEGRIGFLFSETELRKGWTQDERPGGTIIEFLSEGNVNLPYWFGHDRPDVINRLCVFAKTGAEGSMAAFWLDETDQQCIVHLGSGSGSLLCCVLAETTIDFLRLLAIGYDEICWNDEFLHPPNAPDSKTGLHVHPNLPYQDWVRHTFDVTIPKQGIDIVKTPAEMGDRNSADRFCRWVERNR